MPKVAIVYFSETNTTHHVAHEIEKGCLTAPNTQALTHRITSDEIIQGRFINADCLTLIDQSDAVIFGSPTFMGGPAAQFKAFADATSDRWDTQQWSQKLAAGFTVGANPNGDQLGTLQYFSLLASQHGMLWVNLDIPGGFDDKGRNELGSQLGFAAHTLKPELSASNQATAFHLGKRVANMALAFNPTTTHK